ncbi:hypothetical protein PFLUV_G00170590 [Perca fluviatilis]|uniref:Uncharacterized protein n=1 Tax=Perca fluviatilis TaxID=8168 RepID=A0A6A5EQE4_PERFL|nr:hypothetical protein PFLUV_G00170590 [Perca fluviatilis]
MAPFLLLLFLLSKAASDEIVVVQPGDNITLNYAEREKLTRSQPLKKSSCSLPTQVPRTKTPLLQADMLDWQQVLQV